MKVKRSNEHYTYKDYANWPDDGNRDELILW